MLAGLRYRLPSPADRTLNRLIAWLGIILVVSVAAFAAYYYWDRYGQSTATGPSPIEQAIARAEEAAMANPEDFSARMALAGVYFVSERYGESAEQYRAAVAIDDKSTAAISGLARALFEAGNIDEAAANFQKIADTAQTVDLPVDQVGAANYYLARIALSRNDGEAAITYAQAALAVDRSDADSWQLLGAAFVAAGNWDQAIVALQRAIAFVPDFQEAFEQLAVAYEQKGMSGEARYARGMLLYSEEKYGSAAKELQAAINEAPAFANARLGLAMTREKQHRTSDAIALYQQTMQLDASNFMARNALARLGRPWQDTAGAAPSSSHLPASQPAESR